MFVFKSWKHLLCPPMVKSIFSISSLFILASIPSCELSTPRIDSEMSLIGFASSVVFPLKVASEIFTLCSLVVDFSMVVILIGPASTITDLSVVSFRAPHFISSDLIEQEMGNSMHALFSKVHLLVTTQFPVIHISSRIIVPLKVKLNMSDKKSTIASIVVFTTSLILQLLPVT